MTYVSSIIFGWSLNFWKNFTFILYLFKKISRIFRENFTQFLGEFDKFTLELNPARSTDYIEKCFKRKLSKIKFPTKIR